MCWQTLYQTCALYFMVCWFISHPTILFSVCISEVSILFFSNVTKPKHGRVLFSFEIHLYQSQFCGTYSTA